MDALIRVHPRPLSCPCLKLAGYLAAMRFLLPFLPILLSIGPLSAQTWEPVGSGASSTVYALEPFGGELFAGGVFTAIGGVNTDYLARWNGTAWSSIGNLAVYMAADGLYANDTQLFIGDGVRLLCWTGLDMVNITGASRSMRPGTPRCPPPTGWDGTTTTACSASICRPPRDFWSRWATAPAPSDPTGTTTAATSE